MLHCTATPQPTTIASLKEHWKTVMGWQTVGYHYVIMPTGAIFNLLDIEKVSNGVSGYNSNAIHISYIGGVDQQNKAVDNRTEAQKIAQIELIKQLWEKFPNARVLGHRDFPNVKKDCPSFDVATWLKEVKLEPPLMT